MNKKIVITQIRNGYVNVIEFKNDIQKLHLGFDVKKNRLALSQAESTFGKWLKQDGQYLNQLTSFQKLEEKHLNVHRIYQAIYKLSIDIVTKDGVEMLVSTSNNLKEDKKRLIDAYCKDFLKATNKLTTSIKKLYNEVASLPSDCFTENQLLTRD